MIDITGKLPKSIIDNLEKLNVIIEDIQIAGDDIDITLTKDNLKTYLYGVYLGQNKWNVEEIDDNANLFPDVEEGDVITADLITKLFTNIITSSLILSFNPLGRIKYGIKDVVGKVKDTVGKVKDWAVDDLKAEEAQNFLRTKGPFNYKAIDPRDNKETTMSFDGSRVKLGKLESLGKMGHFKALTGNPATKDYQVWHLYKNGNQLRVLDLKAGLEADESLYVYDNNIPQQWKESDWNPDAEEDNTTEGTENTESSAENTSTDTESAANASQNEESNVTEGQTEKTDDNSGDIYYDSSDVKVKDVNDGSNVTEGQAEESNVTEGKDNNQNKDNFDDDDDIWEMQLENIQSSLDTNVIEGEIKDNQNKSKYNGCNVTGCEDGTFGPTASM